MPQVFSRENKQFNTFAGIQYELVVIAKQRHDSASQYREFTVEVCKLVCTTPILGMKILVVVYSRVVTKT
jgi:hypothetical protein